MSALARVGASAAAAVLLAGCAAPPPAPADAVCDALRQALPTWSRADTEQSRAEAADFLAPSGIRRPLGGGTVKRTNSTVPKPDSSEKSRQHLTRHARSGMVAA